jgi:O-antigen/teichoic acid export membrane protein
MINLKSILKNKKMLVLADQAVSSGSSFCITFLLARMLLVEEFGLYSGVILVIYLLISASNALVIQPLQVSIPTVNDTRSYLNFTFWFQLFTNSIFVIGIIIITQFNFNILKGFNELTIQISLVVFSFLLHDFFRKLFLATDNVSHALWIDSIAGFSQLSFLAFTFINGSLNLSGALYISGLSYLAGSLFGVYLLKPRFHFNGMLNFFLKDHITQGKWLLFTAVIQWWSGNLFVVASGIFLGSVALGAFRLVQSLFGVLNILLQSFENYVLPQAARLFQSSIEESKEYLRNISLKSALLFGAVLTILFFFSEPIIRLAGGDKYAPYAYVVKGMAVLYFIIFIGYPVRMAVRMMVMNHIFFMGYLVTFFFSLLTFNFLLREWQLWGAIIGLIANQLILISFWQYFLFKKQFLLWK